MTDTIMTLYKSPRNNAVITQLSPSNHPLSERTDTVRTSLRAGLFRYAAMAVLLLCLSIGNVWGETEISFSPLAKVQKSSGVYVISNNTTPSSLNPSSTNGWKVDSNPIRISSFSANITKIVFTGVTNSSGSGSEAGGQVKVSADSTSFAKLTTGFSLTDAAGSSHSSTDGISLSKYGGSATTVTLEFSSPQQYIHICKASSNGKQLNIWTIKVYTDDACTPCTFKSGDKVYFQDQSNKLTDIDDYWKVSSGNVYAYFWNDTENAWSSYGNLVDGSWNSANAIYEITVPGTGKEYTHVLFTRGSSNTCFDCSSTWDKTTDQSPCEGKDLFYLSQDKYADHIYEGSWGNFTPAGKTVYFDNRNVIDWTTAYVRIGHGESNNVWGPMTKVAGTRNLYSQTTSKWVSHTDFSIANKAGWTGSNHIDQPEKTYTNGSWSGSEYKMTKQTNYQQYAIEDDIYICPKTTSVLEHECQFYQVTNANSTTSSRIDEYTTALSLPSYSVTSSASHCTVTMVKYTADDGSTYDALSSGGTVLPTQYIKVTVTPDANYQFSSVEVTGAGIVTAAAAGTPGVYYITGDATVTATCTCVALTVNRGGTEATPAGGVPVGTPYGTLTCSASTGVIASYQWKQNTTASTSGAVNAVGSGATTASFSPNPASADSYYYYCVATDACGNSVNTSFSGLFTFNAATYTLTVSGASVDNPMTEESKTGTISGVTITGSPVSSIPSGTTTSISDNAFTVNKGTPETVTASATVAGSSAECDECTYVFDHWTNVPASVTANVSTIEAVYNTTYTISFKETDGSAVSGISSTYYVYGVGKLASTLPTPTKSGYEFGGWYQENTLTNAATDIDDEAYGNVRYYAKWTVDCKKSLSKVVLTSYNTGTVTGYNDSEYAGTAYVNCENSSPQSAEVDASHDGTENGYKLGSTGHYVFATIKKGNFRVGDIVKITITKLNDTYTFPDPINAKTAMDIYYGDNSSHTLLTTITGVTAVGTYEYTLTAADVTAINTAGKKGLGIYRDGTRKQNYYVYSVEIVGCREKATIYNFASGDFNDWSTCNGGDLSMTGSQLGVSYQLYKDGVAYGDPKAGTGSNLSWHVTANGTYTVKSVEDATYVETEMNGSAVITLNDPTLVGESSVAVRSTITLTHPNARETNNWESSNPAVATVSSTGVVTGVSIGSATITFHGLGSCNGTKVITVTAPPKYMVTYHDRRRSEGASAPTTTLTGTVPMDANEYDAGDVVTVAGNTGNLTFVIGGATATFGGWVTNENGWIADRDGWRGNFYAAGATFEMPSSNVDLYAVWTFPMAYFTNGGTINDVSYDTYYTYTYNIDDSGIATATDLPSEVTKTGYDFGGWYHDAELTDGPYDALGIMGYWYGQFNAYAKWTEKMYDITYNSNGGSGSMSNTHGHYVTIANNEFTYSDYIFNGWNTAANGSGTSYDAGEEIELTDNLTLYAQWKLDYTITWGNVQIGGAGATVTPNLGGGNYTITVNTGVWTGSLTADMLSASAGVTITNVTVDNSGSPKTATLTFSVGADVAGSTITLTIDVPAHGDYSAKTDNHVISIDRCSSSGEPEVYYSYTISSTSTVTNASTTGGTFTSYNNGSTLGSASGFYTLKDNDIAKAYFIINTTNTIAIGDRISVTTNSTEFDLYTSAGVEVADNVTTYYTVVIGDGIAGTKSFKIGRHDSGSQFKTFTVASIASNMIETSLTWSGGLNSDGSSVVEKNEGVADFIYTATPDNNTLGAITYTSNDAHVTVSSTGTVHIGDGIDFGGAAYKDITISATVARSGCYESSTITYTLRVNNSCEDVAGTIETIDLGCDKQMTVSGHTAEAGVSYQWYKVGSPDVAVGTNSATYTTSTPGSYYVIVTNTGDGHCAMASKNTIVIEEREGFEISKIVDYWYVKNGRRTPDIELVQTANAGSFTVKVSGSTIDNIGGCHFYLGDDGIIYLKGTQDNGDAPSGLTDGEYITIRVTVNQECGAGTSYVDIVIRCQGATTRPSIAFVVDGTKDDGFDADNEEHSVQTALYQFLDYGEDLSGAFDLTGQNIYSTTDEKLIREHYSQFDAILVTDDPSTKANPSGISGKEAYKTKGYVNAFGALIDVRPILTMEAYVSALANWNCVKGDPTSPNPRQYEMRLQCKNHEIYGGLPIPSSGPGITNVWAEFIDGDEYRHVIMVDSTLSPYTGIAYNEQTGGKENPALQGFTLEAMGELLGLGVISDGALQAGIERQHEPAARMMILGINAKALPHALTPEGKKVIENAITYLLKTNMEDVDDCSNFFVGGTSGHEKDWSTLTNWSKGSLPSTESKVRILAPCEISNAVGHVAQIEIASSGSSKTRYTSRGDATCDGNLVIAADGALVVNGKIYRAVAPYFNSAKLSPTSPDELKIEANSEKTGALIFDNKDGKAQATVEMYSASYWEVVDGKKKKWWSYVGVPITDVEIPNYFYLGFTYLYDETSGWIKKWDGSVLQPFEGIGLSMQSGHKETFYGTLASTATKEITLTYTGDACKGENLIGNSWTAPIQIANLDTADFGGATATVYVYNTGRDDPYKDPTYVEATEENDGAATAGQWVGVPISVAGLPGYTGLKVVPAMNAFQVNTSSDATLTLDYDKLVRKNAVTNANINNPLRAPRRIENVSEIEALMRVRVTGEYTHTDVWLLQDEQFTDEFDNGWEAKYQDCDNRSAQMYAESELGRMAFLAKQNIDGTVLGFAPSRDGNAYTFSFYFIGDEALYLNDMQLETSTLIDAENTYTFTYSEEDMAERFIISRQAFGVPAITTGNESINDDAKPIKFIKDDHIFILVRGILYDITGKVVK